MEVMGCPNRRPGWSMYQEYICIIPEANKVQTCSAGTGHICVVGMIESKSW